MKDEIFYCSDIEQLKQELKDNDLVDAEGNCTHGNTLTPIKYNGFATLSLVRDNKLDLTLFPSLTNLGTYDEMFADNTAHDLYKSVYDYETPIVYIDEYGVEQSYSLPIKIGSFA